jgi:hypothetical protein
LAQFESLLVDWLKTKYKYDTTQSIHLVYCKNFCKYHNAPPAHQWKKEEKNQSGKVYKVVSTANDYIMIN